MDLSSLEVGELVENIFLVAEAQIGVDRRGQNYYTLKLNGEGGWTIDGKIWSDNIGATISAGVGLELLARVDEFQGAKQLNVQRYKVLSANEFDLSGYVRSTTIDVDAAFDTLFNWDAHEFKAPWLKALMAQFRSNEGFVRDFKASPAATRHHHNYMGGLAEHTLDVWNLCERLCEHFGPRIERDVLLAGAALHDVGKTKSYSLTAGVSQTTDWGHLIDHIFISASMVSNLWDRAVTPEVVGDRGEEAARHKALLLHLILSHHGRKEWGSPVLPQTSEAVLLHMCDQLSASMKSTFDAVDECPESEHWTRKVFLHDAARRLYVSSGPEDAR